MKSGVLLGAGAVAIAAVIGACDVGSAEARPTQNQTVDVGRARARLRAAREGAHQATVDYQTALDEEARLEGHFQNTAERVKRVEARVRRSQRRVEAAAVARYRGEVTSDVLKAIDTDGPLEAGRLARVVDALAERDERILDRHQAERAALAVLLEQQRAIRDAQRAVVEQLDETNTRLTSEMSIATKAYQAIRSQPVPETPTAADTSGPVCPIQAPVTFTDDWHAPRSGGRLHEGNDIFAELGTPNVAVVDGEMTQTSGGLGGTGVSIVGDDGTRYYYGHLSGWEGPSRRVVRGEVVGYTGNTGNAAGGPHHTHFQIHPGGGEPVNPYPTLVVSCAEERGRKA